ncbi:hypothetical protein F4859DRAFT_475184 [Xylaria cf. heliscus]|nr:hypothetical protein F4859DRAFT_475184 [Xylaria cf. heliscus]
MAPVAILFIYSDISLLSTLADRSKRIRLVNAKRKGFAATWELFGIVEQRVLIQLDYRKRRGHLGRWCFRSF